MGLLEICKNEELDMFEQLKEKKRKVRLRTDKRIERLEIQRTMKEMQFLMFRADNLRHFSIKP